MAMINIEDGKGRELIKEMQNKMDKLERKIIHQGENDCKMQQNIAKLEQKLIVFADSLNEYQKIYNENMEFIKAKFAEIDGKRVVEDAGNGDESTKE